MCFPKPSSRFLLGNAAVREVFLKHHADLLDAAFWQSHQERIRAGHVHDVFPYEREKRFSKIYKPGAGDEPALIETAARAHAHGFERHDTLTIEKDSP